MYDISKTEKNNQRKGMTISFVCHAMILLLIFVYKLPKVDAEALEDKPPFAVKLDFHFEESSLSKLAFDDPGASRPKAESASEAPKTEEQKTEEQPQEQPKEEVVKPEEIKVTTPKEIPEAKPSIKIPVPVPRPVPAEPIKVETPAEEAPVVVTTPTKSAPVPDVVKPRPSPPASTPPTTAPPATTSDKPKTTTTGGNGSTSGNASTKSSTTIGEGTGKANEGKGSGATKGDDGDEGKANSSSGTGAYDGSGNGIFGRKVIYRNTAALKGAMRNSGVVAMKMCINRAGIVTFTEIIPSETTVRDRDDLRNYLKVLKTYKFQPDAAAPVEECGKYLFKVDNTINNQIR